MALIRLEDIGQEFRGGYTLKNVSLTIERGESFAIIGPTGAGKTTLIRIIDLLDRPATGSIYFNGTDVTRSKRLRLKARRRMAYVQQRPAVFNMNVYGNVSLGLRWRHVRQNLIREKVELALEAVGMADYRRRDARTLSGGEVQRLAIARALVTGPELLLMDEPTASLDPISAEKIEDIMSDIIRSRQTTIVMSTHDRAQGQRLASNMGVIMNGEVLQVGTPAEIFRSPARRRVADFVGVGNMLSGIIEERIDESLALIKINGTSIQAISEFERGSPVWAIIRTEDVTFSLERTITSARNVFEGPITRLTPSGTLVRIEIDCGFPLVGVVTAKTVEEMGLRLETRLFASFKATAIHIILRRT